MIQVYHYTNFDRARSILTGRGLDPTYGQPCCHEHRPGRVLRGLRALVEPDPSTWRRSSVFGDYTAMLMRLIEDRLCLEVDVADDEALVVERAAIEGYMHGCSPLSLPGRLPEAFRYFRRESAEAAMWRSRVAPSYRAAWSSYLLPKVIIVAPIPAHRIRICALQPYLLDPRWDSAATRQRAAEFDIAPFPELWRQLTRSDAEDRR